MPTYAVTIVHGSGKREEIEVTAPTVDDAEQIAAMRPGVQVGRVMEIDAVGFQHKPDQQDQSPHASGSRPGPVDTGACTLLMLAMGVMALVGVFTVAAGLSADITVGNTVNIGLVSDRTNTVLIGCAIGVAGLVGVSLAVAAKTVARSMSAHRQQ